MTSFQVVRYPLDFDKTLSYFVNHIEAGNTLSEKVVKKINFHQGTFSTILPHNANLESLFLFDRGGIIPSIPYGNTSYSVEGLSEPFHPRQVITMDHECAKFICEYLKKNIKCYAVLEDCLTEPDSPYANIDHVKMLAFGKEVYYLLDKSTATNEVYQAIRQSSTCWHFLCVLSAFKNPPCALSDDILEAICINAECIIISAYDGESYIFWEKQAL
ncbi:MAG: hypothetical protein FJZ58_08185 [Chlamydiae bacterium]|nr:hypothetical protein [Chlamydiota bacterium]